MKKNLIIVLLVFLIQYNLFSSLNLGNKLYNTVALETIFVENNINVLDDFFYKYNTILNGNGISLKYFLKIFSARLPFNNLNNIFNTSLFKSKLHFSVNDGIKKYLFYFGLDNLQEILSNFESDKAEIIINVILPHLLANESIDKNSNLRDILNLLIEFDRFDRVFIYTYRNILDGNVYNNSDINYISCLMFTKFLFLMKSNTGLMLNFNKFIDVSSKLNNPFIFYNFLLNILNSNNFNFKNIDVFISDINFLLSSFSESRGNKILEYLSKFSYEQCAIFFDLILESKISNISNVYNIIIDLLDEKKNYNNESLFIQSINILKEKGYSIEDYSIVLSRVIKSNGNNTLYFLKFILPKMYIIFDKSEFKCVLDKALELNLQNFDNAMMENFKDMIFDGNINDVIEKHFFDENYILINSIFNHFKLGNKNSIEIKRIMSSLINNKEFKRLSLVNKEIFLVFIYLQRIGKTKFSNNYAYVSYIKAKDILEHDSKYREYGSIILPLILFSQNYQEIIFNSKIELFKENFDISIDQNIDITLSVLRDKEIYSMYLLFLKSEIENTNNTELRNNILVFINMLEKKVEFNNDYWFPQLNLPFGFFIYDVFNYNHLDKLGIIDIGELNFFIHAKTDDNNVAVFNPYSEYYLGINGLHSVLSASYWFGAKFYTFNNSDQGVVLFMDNKDILFGSKFNQGSGFFKNFSDLLKWRFESNLYLLYIKKFIKKICEITISNKDIKALLNKIKIYSTFKDIPNDFKFQLTGRNKEIIFDTKTIRGVFSEIIKNNYLNDKSYSDNKHNEFVVISPKTEGVFVFDSLENLSNNLYNLAKDCNLPVFVINKDKLKTYNLFSQDIIYFIVDFLRTWRYSDMNTKSLIYLKIAA